MSKRNAMAIGLFCGSTGYDIGASLSCNPHPPMPGYPCNCPMLAMESDSSYSTRFASLSPLSPHYDKKTPLHATILSVPGLDLLDHFAHGELRHWDFVPHPILKLEQQERTGFAHDPPLGHLATLIHRGAIERQLKTVLEEVVDTQRKEERKLVITMSGNGSGGTGCGSIASLLEVQAGLLSTLEGSVDAQVLLFVTMPDFQRDRQLSDRLRLNGAALLRTLPCLQSGIPRHAICSVEGYGDYTHRPIPFELILVSDLGDGSVTPTHLVSTQALIIWLLTATPMREAWQRLYTNLRGELAGGDIPLVSRMGASTIFLPIQEEQAYRCHRQVEFLGSRASAPHADAASLATEYLLKKGLSETENDAQLSRRLAKWGGHHILAQCYRPLAGYSPKERDPLKAVLSARNFFERAEEQVLPRVESRIAADLPPFMDALTVEIGGMCREMEQICTPGELSSILREMVEEVRRQLEEMDVLEGELTKMIEQRRKQAFLELQHTQKLARLPWTRRLGKGGEMRHGLSQYVKYRHDIVHRLLSLKVKKGARTAATHVLGQLRMHRERYDGIVRICGEVDRQAETDTRRFLADDFASRGLGIALHSADSYEPRYQKLDLDNEGWKTIGAALQKECYSEPPDAAGLYRYLEERCRRFVEDRSSHGERDITSSLLADPDHTGKIRSALRMARELLPADEVIGAGKRMLLILLPGGNQNPLCHEFSSAAADLKLACVPEFVDNPNPSFIAILRWEVGRDLRSVHLCREFDQALEAELLDGGVTSFITPYWLTAPSPFVKISPLRAQALFVKASLVGALMDRNGELFYRTATDTELLVPGLAGDALAAFWEEHFGAQVDLAGRYMVHLQNSGFGAVAKELGGLQKAMEPDWKGAISTCLKEVKRIAEAYHQTI